MVMNLIDVLMSGDPVAILRGMVADGSLANFDKDISALKMEIPRGFHHKDNLEHSIRVLDNAIKRETAGPDLVLRAAALLHDIGKPATRVFDGRANVSFDGHEHVGAKLVKKILKRHGFSKGDISLVSDLVMLHMRSHGFDPSVASDSSVRRLITDAGSTEQMDRLLIIFYSDCTTKNDAQRRKVHASVDELAEFIDVVREKDARRAMRPAISGHDVMEVFGIESGPLLGKVMKELNRDENITLSREDALKVAEKLLS